MQNTTHGNLQTPTAVNAKLLSTYDTAGSVPLIDFGNKYVVSGTYDPPSRADRSDPSIRPTRPGLSRREAKSAGVKLLAER